MTTALSKTRNLKALYWCSAVAIAVPFIWSLVHFFGIGVVLLLTPLTGAAVVAYRMHLSRLAEKPGKYPRQAGFILRR
ncbi:MAG: hypothetical protein IPG22_04205 [Acidobacteria bacterium]|nr:hypothetical protein [Acidobacteriota bacterium]